MKKKNVFNCIFNLNFVDCLNHFRGTQFIKELNGMKLYKETFKKLNCDNKDEDYEYLLKYHLFNYEKIIMAKNGRNANKRK